MKWGAYSSAGKWHWLALCGDNKELAENKKEQAFRDYGWVDVKIELLTDKEITLEMLKEYLKECDENTGNYSIHTITLYKATTDALYFVHEVFEC